MSEVLSDYAGAVKPETVEINGLRFNLGEFNMRTRALWLDVAEEYDLSNLQSKLQSEVLPRVSRMGTGVENDPRIRSIQKRIEKLEAKHDEIMNLYATDDEPEDIDEQIERVVARLETASDELDDMFTKVQEEVIHGARDAEKEISELMKVQDEARVKFVWMLANAAGRTDKDFETFLDECDSDDYRAADRFLSSGNAQWASLYMDRMQQERPKKTRAN